MKQGLDMGKVCQYGSVLFVSYQTSPVYSDRDTFYLDTKSGETTNFHTPSVTQWHWNPKMKDGVALMLQEHLQNTREIVDCNDYEDMWFKKKMTEVLKVLSQ